MKFCRWIYTLLLVLVSVTVIGQNKYVVSGMVADSMKNDHIFYAFVSLLKSDTMVDPVVYTYTDEDGNFTLDPVPAGDYVLYCSLVGYSTIRQHLYVGGDSRSIDVGRISMLKTSTMLKGVTVTASKPVFSVEGEKMLYNVSEDPAIHSGTATDALQNAPGVEVDIEGNVSVRGGGSVEIWLNDRPSNMNADALKNFLQQMPADNIERIEVITNPSAKYNAGGDGSIINIVTVSKIKKNSFISFGVRGSTQPGVSPWLSYVYASPKFSFNIYVDYSFSNYKNQSTSGSVLYDDSGDTSSTFVSKSGSKSIHHRMGVYMNASYMPDSMNTLSFWGGTYPGIEQSQSESHVQHREYISNPGIYDYTSRRSGIANVPIYSVGGYGGINYMHKFNDLGHELSANISYNGYKSYGEYMEEKDYVWADLADMNRKNISASVSNSVSAGLDYTIPYHKNGEIELGVSGGYSYNKGYTRRDTLVWGYDAYYQTDSIRLHNCVNNNGDFSAYATLQHKFGGFTLKGGLRTQYKAFQYDYIDFPEYNFAHGYWGLYPSLHLSYSTRSMHNFRLSYTRRVSYPSGENITTFISYGDDGYSTGNPDLLPEYTNSVEAGWSKYINKFGNIGISAYFRNTKNKVRSMSDVIFDPYFDRIVTYSRPMNAGKTLNTGLDLNVTYRLKAFMSLRFYTNVYYQKQEFMFRNEDDMRKVDNVSYSFRLNFWAKLWKVLEVNVSGNYRSKSIDMFFITRPRYSIDCGLRAEFWQHHISVYLDVSDIFNWNKQRSQSVNPYYTSSSVSTNSWSSRSIRAGITFRFGKMELESQARQTGSEGM